MATLSTFEEKGLTPEVQSDINKALVKLGGATLEALLSEVLDNADEITTPFGPADVGLSVLIGILEGFNKYSEQFEYYRDDGLPEDIAKKEAILDAVSGGMHEAMSNCTAWMMLHLNLEKLWAKVANGSELSSAARLIPLNSAVMIKIMRNGFARLLCAPPTGLRQRYNRN